MSTAVAPTLRLLALLALLVPCGAVPRVFVVTLHAHLGFDARHALWRAHGLHPARHVFRAPAAYLVAAHPRRAHRLLRDSRVSAVAPLHPHLKSSLLAPAADTSGNGHGRAATLRHDVGALCRPPSRRRRGGGGALAADLRAELPGGTADAAEHADAYAGHALIVTSLCFYNAADCGSFWRGRDAEMRALLGADAGLLDERATQHGRRVLVLRVPRGTSLCTVARRLARLPHVVGIERRPAYAVLNAFAAAAVQSGASAPVSVANAPLWRRGLLGQGEVVGIADTGVDLDSCYFREPPANDTTAAAPLGQGKCDMRRRKVVCYYVADAAAFGDDASRGGGGHGTHVAGTIAGLHAAAAALAHDPDALLKHVANRSDEMNGVAPLARIAVNDIGAGRGPLAAPADVATSPFVAEPYTAAGVRIHSNSWGCGASPRNPRTCNAYDALARSMDEFMWLNKDALLVVAAGNSGDSGAVDGSEDDDDDDDEGEDEDEHEEKKKYRNGFYTVGAPATFKNGVAVGATQRGEKGALCSGLDSEPVECSLENLFVASARGPTLDGRVKPDVVFPGEQIVSARSSGNSATRSYGASCSADPRMGVHVFSGTSMACPGVAGALVLIRQYYREFNPTTGRREDVEAGPLGDGKGPSGALLKATLIATAVPLSGWYTSRSGMRSRRTRARVADADRPELLQGHGRPQLDRVLRFADAADAPDLLVFDRYDLGHGEKPHVHAIRVAPDGHFAATLVYADAPGPVQEAWETDRVLVNDLDLAATCGQAQDCNCSSVSLVSESRVDNVERVPRGGGVVAASRGTVVEVQVKALKVVTRRQPYALVVVGRGLSLLEGNSTGRNWTPDWSKAVRYPRGAEPPERTRQRMLNWVIVVVAVVGAAAVVAGLVAMGVFCWRSMKGEEDSAMESVELGYRQEFSM